MDPFSKSKFIVITGGTRGCGRALVEWFISQGHHIAACGRARHSVEALTERFGQSHHFSAVDVSDAGAVLRWAQHVVREVGPPHLLINNAAVIARNAPLWEVPADDISAVLDVNIRGTVNTIRGFVPAMISARRGVIVNFSSGWGRSTSPEVAIYCASKFAIEGLTSALAQELPDPLAAVAINPGIIDTDMLRSCFGQSAASYPNPAAWVQRAGPFLLNLSTRDSGKSLDVPGVPVS